MTQTDPLWPIEEEAVALAEALFEDRISPEQSVRLEDLVVSHPEIARAYLGYAHLWCALPLHVVPLAIRPETLLDLDERGSERGSKSMNESMVMPAISEDDEVADEAVPTAPPVTPLAPRRSNAKVVSAEVQAAPQLPVSREPVATALRPVPGLQNSRRNEAPRQPMRLPLGARWIAAAAIILMIAGTATLWTRRPAAPGTPAATLAQTIDAKWIGAPVVDGTKIPSGDHVRLASGLARIDFDGGATVILEGPADLQIAGRSEAQLESGKLTATVPAPARGFAIRTPSARIVDLGTEFGIEARADGSTHVEVFRGTVEARALQPSNGAGVQTLTANQAADVSANGASVTAAAPRPVAFTSAPEFAARAVAKSGSAYDRWLAYSYTLRRDPSAVLFYTFEQDAVAPEQLTNHATAAAGRWNIPMDQYRPSWSTGRWDRKGAMSFDPAKSQHLFLKDFPLTRNGQLTVSAWVFARSRPQWASIVKNWGAPPASYGQFHLGLFWDGGDLDCAIGLADRSQFELQEAGHTLFPIGQWEHVACVTDSATFSLFRDGRLVASSPCGKLIPTPAFQSLGIGYKPGDPPGYWDGKIDELAVFHRAFSADEIRRMYEAGKP